MRRTVLLPRACGPGGWSPNQRRPVAPPGLARARPSGDNYVDAATRCLLPQSLTRSASRSSRQVIFKFKLTVSVTGARSQAAPSGTVNQTRRDFRDRDYYKAAFKFKSVRPRGRLAGGLGRDSEHCHGHGHFQCSVTLARQAARAASPRLSHWQAAAPRPVQRRPMRSESHFKRSFGLCSGL